MVEGVKPVADDGDDTAPVAASGMSVWRIEGGPDISGPDRIEVGAERCAWTVGPIEPGAEPVVVADESRPVRSYMRRVLSEKERVARRATVRPVPKPVPSEKKRSAPVTQSTMLPGEVACPLCLGESWPDCECCAGDGWISRQRVARWKARHSD